MSEREEDRYHRLMVELGDRGVFVFGSNLAGRHGAGAAKVAREMYGAVPSVGDGLMGRCYALPTKDDDLNTLSWEEQVRWVRVFLQDVAVCPDRVFVLTRVGCGLAGRPDAEMAPLFAECPPNVIQPLAWVSP